VLKAVFFWGGMIPALPWSNQDEKIETSMTFWFGFEKKPVPLVAVVYPQWVVEPRQPVVEGVALVWLL